MCRRLLVSAITVALSACSSAPVIEQSLVRCPAAPPDVDCPTTVEAEGVIEDLLLERWIAVECWRRRDLVWLESWTDCGK